MFKSLSIKIAMMFVLLTVSIIILIGAFMTGSINTFYDTDFKNQMSLIFNEDYIKELNRSIEVGARPEELYNSVSVYNGQVGVDTFRNLYLLDGKTGRTVGTLSTNTVLAETLEISLRLWMVRWVQKHCPGPDIWILPFLWVRTAALII